VPVTQRGVCIALGATAYVASPTWTSINRHCTRVEINRGRAFELDKTQTGEMTFTIADTDGTFDPTNNTSSIWPNFEVNKQVAYFLTNPHTSSEATLFRGFIEDIQVTVDPSLQLNTVTVTCVDAFDRFANTEIVPDGNYGASLTSDSGDVVYGAQQVDDRIKAALADADWPTGLENIFSGNVSVQATTYSSGDTILQVMQDAADAEFPGVANLYMSKDGLVTFHGRLARFDPTNVTYGITDWKAGDATAAASDPTHVARISGLTFERSKGKIINACIATPNGMAEADRAGQVVTDAGAITAYGISSRSFENLITQQGDESGTPAALAETKKFATYYVDNYAAPRNRVKTILFKVRDPATSAGTATWALLCGVEISDRIAPLVTHHPGGGGFNENFFIEGLSYTIVPMTGDYPQVDLELDLSPTSYYTTDPF
jgi:hypothetical protein